MNPIIEVRLLLLAPSEWQYRLMMGGGTVLTDDCDDCFPGAGHALKAALEAARAEQMARRTRYTHDEG